MRAIIGKTASQLKVGEKSYFAKTLSESDIVQYSGITGDVNPMVVDEEFARNTRYGKRVVHGMLIASFFSTIMGTKLPGPGSFFVNYKFRFLKPVYIGDTVEMMMEITGVNEKENLADVKISCINQDGVEVMSGTGIVRPPVPLD